MPETDTEERPVPTRGAELWRSVEELLDAPETRAGVARELGEDPPESYSRRTLLRLLGATAALAGTGACMQEPRESILPYARQPKHLQPGTAVHYATSAVIGGYAEGLLVKAQDGRPLKVDGNPDHPATLGGSSIHHQALLFELYDPQRARATTLRGQPKPHEDFTRDFVAPALLDGGAGLWFLLEPTTSPTCADVLARLRERLPHARVCFHTPDFPAARQEGLRRATGAIVEPRCDVSAASVVATFGADFLFGGPFSVRYARQFADRRRLLDASRTMNRLYAVETDLSVTGMSADERLALKPSRVREAVLELLSLIATAVPGQLPAGVADALRQVPPSADRGWLQRLARDLLTHPGESAVLGGDGLPPEAHVWLHAINALLQNLGRTVLYASSPIFEAGAPSHDLALLMDELRSGAVRRLVIVGGNPVSTLPAHLQFATLLAQVPQTACFGLYSHATARAAQWFMPESQLFESWGDARALDGTLSFVQPLIEPLYDTQTRTQLLAAFTGGEQLRPRELLRRSWSGRDPLREVRAWDEALQTGFIPGTAFAPLRPETRWDAVEAAVRSRQPATPAACELSIRPDLKVLDGRFANNLWLLELPDPVTKLTWENAALLSPATAAARGLETGRHVRVSRGDRQIEVPVLIQPGHADDALTLPLGFGAASKAWDGDWLEATGVNAAGLLETPGEGAFDVRVDLLPGTTQLAVTQVHWTMDGRPIAMDRTLDEWRRDPVVPATEAPLDSMFPPVKLEAPEQWGMAIDLSVCTGCSACVLACQAENNTPVVGKKGVLNSREMHWIRIDRYFHGALDAPAVLTQPMLCQHCEKAPCEYVCPVNATTHSPDGLNEMTYNRCVGTRFCQNNCPYKVRRFNWFDYNIRKPATLRMLMNPDVTVRARGVIEKCTYCVQRIRNGQITAQKENRPIRDGEIVTACQEACPSRAIAFGNIADPLAEVTGWMRQPRAYRVLEELGTQPRTRYLAKIRNPNPEAA